MMLNIYKWLCNREFIHLGSFPLHLKKQTCIQIKAVPRHLFSETNARIFFSFFSISPFLFFPSLILIRNLKLVAKVQNKYMKKSTQFKLIVMFWL